VNCDEPPHSPGKRFTMQICGEGTITCGRKCFTANEPTIRSAILKIIGQSDSGHLLRKEYTSQLIEAYIRPSDSRMDPERLKTEPYLRRKNNVDKALSRLRKDLDRVFQDDVPADTSWMSFSKKIDGWLLYRLPSRGCDGDYHP
jgi:hypothetical protein